MKQMLTWLKKMQIHNSSCRFQCTSPSDREKRQKMKDDLEVLNNIISQVDLTDV